MKHLTLLSFFLMITVSGFGLNSPENALNLESATTEIVTADKGVNDNTLWSNPAYKLRGFELLSAINNEIFSESFDVATSVDGWTQAGDAAGKPAEVTFEHATTAGVGGTGAMRYGGTNADGVGGRAYIVEKVFTDIDFGGATDVIVSVSIKSEGLVGTNLAALTDIGGNIVNKGSLNAELSESDFVTYTFEHTGISGSANAVKLQFNVAAGATQGDGGTILIDDLKVMPAEGSGGGGPEIGVELITNGDFQLGNDGSWTGNAFNIQTDGGNSFNFANVMQAGNPFDVNLSQTVRLYPGASYELKFDASTGAGNTRTMVVGIGQSANPFYADTETVTLTENSQTFTLPFKAIDDGTGNTFGDENSRVLFDMGAATGVVVIDNVSLKAVEDKGVEGTEVFSENFDAATSVDGWTQAGDAAGKPAEVTFEHATTAGVGGTGAMRYGGTNADGVGGRAYIVEKVFTDIDFGGATDVIVSVSIKSEGLVGTNLAALTDIGGNIVNKGSLNAELSESDFVTYTFEHTGISGSANSVKLQFNVAAGGTQDDGGTILIDDLKVFASGEGGGEIAVPATAAPTPPERNAEDVISLFSNAYSNIPVTTWSTDWSAGSTNQDLQVEGDDVKLFKMVNFSGIQLETEIDLSIFTHMHIDYWAADAVVGGEVFNPKLSNHANLPTAGETSAIIQTNPVTTSQEWVSVDLPLADFTIAGGGSDARDKIYQIILATDGTIENIYIDNFYFYKGMPVSIEEADENPSRFALEQNYPNPFNPTTNISFSIPQSGLVTLDVFNVQGQKVATLVNGFKASGSHDVTFDAANLASGVYIYRLVSGSSVKTQKMMLIK